MPASASRELVEEPGAAIVHALDQTLGAHRLEDREPDGACERRTVPRVAEGEAARALGERLVHVLADEDRADRRVARAEPLRGRDDVGDAGRRRPREPPTGPSDPRHDLVEAHEEAVAVAPLGEPFPEPNGRRVAGERGGADRLAEVRGDVLRTRLLQRPIQRLERRLAGRVEAPRARRDVQVFRQIGTERTVHPGPTGQRERLHRRAVVRLRGRDHLPPVRVAALDVIAARDLDRHLVRVGAAHREPRAGEPLGSDADELLGEALLRRVREALVVHEGERLGLRPSRGDDVAPAVAEGRGHRAAAHRVEVPAAGRVLDPDAVAAHGDRHRPPELQAGGRASGRSRSPSAPPGLLRIEPGTDPGSAAVAYGTLASRRSSVAGQDARTV